MRGGIVQKVAIVLSISSISKRKCKFLICLVGFINGTKCPGTIIIIMLVSTSVLLSICSEHKTNHWLLDSEKHKTDTKQHSSIALEELPLKTQNTKFL